MKRYIKTTSVILFAALTLAGCSKTEEFQGNPDSALQIESVNGISPFALTTKAVITGNTLPGSDAATGIGIFVTATDGGAYDGHANGYANVKFANGGSGWSTSKPVYLSDTQGKLYGYFPYNADATDLTAIPVQSSLNGTDYLYAETQTVSHSNKSVSLSMNHALSRLHLTIKKGANFTASAPLSKITLKSTAIDVTGTMDITTGAITATKAADATGTVELSTDGTITAEGIVKDILLVPADGNEGKKDITIFLTIDGKLAGITLSGENGLDIRSGIQNNVTLTIEDTGIKVIGVGVGVWDEQGSQQVQVGAYSVTVKLSEDVEDAGIAENLIVQCKYANNSLIIEAYSRNEVKPLVVRINGTSIAPVENGNICTFTIPDITSDITATLAYAKERTVIINVAGVDMAPDVEGYVYGTADHITVFEGRPTTLTAVPGRGYDVDYFDINGVKVFGNQSKAIIPNEVDAIDAYFRFSDWLGGVFSVSDGKKVRFSRGNFWYGGQYTFNIESNQYDTTPTTDEDRDKKHISHFFWVEDLSKSIKSVYEDSWDRDDTFFFTNAYENKPNPDFTVNGQKGFWRVLSGNIGGEWEYLLNIRETEYGYNRRYAAVKVNDMAGLLIFPDNFSSWPTEAGGEPQTFNTSSSNWNGKNYTVPQFNVLQNNGCVFLPATGYREPQNTGAGLDGELSVYDVGIVGMYWSSMPSGRPLSAYRLLFKSDKIDPLLDDYKRYACSVRLVTDVK